MGRRRGESTTMKSKDEIVSNWLPRYTGLALDQFGPHILLTNFHGYLDTFARLTGAPVLHRDRPMPTASMPSATTREVFSIP